MRQYLALLVAVLLIALEAALAVHEAASAQSQGCVLGTTETVTLAKTNLYRAQEGVAPVTCDQRLTGIAVLRAGAQVPVLSHEGFAASLMRLGTWDIAGEVLAEELLTDADGSVVDQWINSPPHAVILRHPLVTQIGLGYVMLRPGIRTWAMILMGGGPR